MTALPDRARGALLGTALGDVLGGPNEAKNWAPVPVAAFDPARARISDDTQLTLLVAEALLEGGGVPDGEDVARRLVEWLPHAVGIGSATRAAVRRLEAGVPWERAGEPSAGNGAAMRAAPIGILHGDPEMLRVAARIATLPTHSDAIAVLSATIMAAFVSYLARVSGPFDATALLGSARHVAAPLGDPGTSTRGPGAPRSTTLWTELEAAAAAVGESPACWFADHFSGAFVVESLPAALWCFLRAPDDPAQVLRVAVEHARDADTVGAMAGALVGAHVGAEQLPRDWIDWLPGADRRRLEKTADRLAAAARRVNEIPSAPKR